MLFGTSKLVTEYINRGEGYDKVRKVYSVNIVYFSLGHGKDIVYHAPIEYNAIPIAADIRIRIIGEIFFFLKCLYTQ